MAAPIPKNDRQRLNALEKYSLLDTPADEAFDRITRLAQHIFGTPIALVSLVDKDRQWFKSRQGLDAEETHRDVAFCAHAILDDEVMVVSDATRDGRFSDSPLVQGDPNIRFYAGAPLVVEDGLKLGTLCVIDRAPREFDEAEQLILSDLAKIVSDEMKLRRLASTDTLTSLANRRHFLELAERERRRAVRHGQPLAMAILDIDHFKIINDNHGHPVGDEVLRQLSRLLMDEKRDYDVVGRLGGEEFVLLFPHTDASGAFQVADRLRQSISEMRIDTEETRITITASIGIASLRDSTEEVDELVKRADAALYEAKKAGRNRVIHAKYHRVDAAE